MTFRTFFRSTLHYGFQLIQVVAAVFLLLTTITMAGMLPFPIKVISEYRNLSPIQKYWFTTYLRTEFSPRGGGAYRLLVVEDANKEHWIANAESVLPGATRTAEGEVLLPFVLAPKEQQEGKRLVLLPLAFQDNAYLWESLRNAVYNRKSIKEIGVSGIDAGVKLTLLAYAVVFVVCIVLLFFRVSASMDRTAAEKQSRTTEFKEL
jgi:hypothetical protein